MERTRLVTDVCEAAEKGYLPFFYSDEFDFLKNISNDSVTVEQIAKTMHKVRYNDLLGSECLICVPWIRSSDSGHLTALLESLKTRGYLKSDDAIDKLNLSRALTLYKLGCANWYMLKKLMIRDISECPHCLSVMSNEVIDHPLRSRMIKDGYDIVLCRPDAVHSVVVQNDFPFKHLSTIKSGIDYYLVAWLRGAHVSSAEYGTIYDVHPITRYAQKEDYVAVIHPKQSYDHYHVHLFSTRVTIGLDINGTMFEISPLCYWMMSQLEELISILSGKIFWSQYPWEYKLTHLMCSAYLPIHHDESKFYYPVVVLMSLIYSAGALPLCLYNYNVRSWSAMHKYHREQWENTCDVLNAIEEKCMLIKQMHAPFLKAGKYVFWYLPKFKEIGKLKSTCGVRATGEKLKKFGHSSVLVVPSHVCIASSSSLEAKIQMLYDDV